MDQKVSTNMANANWFESGYGGVDKETEKRDLGGGPKRWWMAGGTSKQVVFIDDEPCCFDEHTWKTENSKFPLSATCIAKIVQEGCPACASKDVAKADYVGHLTMIDCTGYVNKEGKEIKFELTEFCPKLKVMNKLKLKKQNKGSLIGQIYTVTRTDADAPNTGDDFDFVREAKMDVLYKVVTHKGKNLSDLISQANGTGENAVKIRRYLAHQFLIPKDGPIAEEIPRFNYASLHEPFDVADMRRAIVGAVGYGNNKGRGAASGGGSSSSDDVPF